MKILMKEDSKSVVYFMGSQASSDNEESSSTTSSSISQSAGTVSGTIEIPVAAATRAVAIDTGGVCDLHVSSMAQKMSATSGAPAAPPAQLSRAPGGGASVRPVAKREPSIGIHCENRVS